jgi:hypothetical protein
MQRGMDEMEMRSQMRMQLDIIKQCYGDCVNDFRASELNANEKKCLQSCGVRQISAMMILGEAQQSIMSKQGGMGGAF